MNIKIKAFLTGLMLLIMCCGCQNAGQADARLVLDSAQDRYNRADYEGAVNILSGMLKDDISSVERARGYYLRGLAYRELGIAKIGLAEQDFRMSLRYSESKRLSALANIALGHICFESDPPESYRAVSYYQNALRDKADIPLDMVLYRLGVSLQQSGKWAEGQKYLRRCATEFPRSEYARKARGESGSSIGTGSVGGGYSLQVGVYSQMSNAQAAVNKLASLGWDAQIELVTGGGVQYAVRIGGYGTYDQAHQKLTELKRVWPEAFITTK